MKLGRERPAGIILVLELFRGSVSRQLARNRSRYRRWLALRRLSQILFLALFLVHVYAIQYRGSLHAANSEIRLPFPAYLVLAMDPLVAFSNAVATRALYRGMLWSLAILIPTLFLGRFFCGWVCPLGTLNHFFGNLRSERKRGPNRINANRYKRWQAFKYYLLFATLVAALFGCALGLVMHPIALAVRSLALSFYPAVNYAWQAVSGISLLNFRQPHFRQSFLVGVIFMAILFLNLRITRFWCRALCPLGALLGWASRWSILGLEKQASNCGDCNRCLLHCQGGDDPVPGVPWRKAECHLCLNCVAECPENAIRFRLFLKTATTREAPDLERRGVLTSLTVGAAALPLLRANTGLAAEPHERLLRPPAAVDEQRFLATCIRCGQCIKVCPNNALQPAFTEAGWEGFWTPVLVPRIGYCEPSCSLCGQACPTGAIWEFTSKEKGWVTTAATAKHIRLGTAFYDRGRCLPWAMASECIVCEEWCPTSPKAIYLRPAEVIDASGNAVQVRQPYVDAAHCVGCGACEYACPVRDRPAVYVTSVGESRSAFNQLVLPSRPKMISFFPETNEVAGWVKSGETRQFEAADLWKYIDGDAERYLKAGVQRTSTAEYRFQDQVDAAVDLHVMSAPAGAASVFETDASVGSHSIQLGDAGQGYGQSLTFRKGVFFVRIVAYQDAPRVESTLINLARAIEARLPVSPAQQ